MKIPVCAPRIGQKEIEYVLECLRSNWISSASEYVTRFEDKFAKYCGCKYGVATNSGTTALHLALAAVGVRPSDEVIIPTFTMIATANAVSYTGARPVLVDAELETWNIDASMIKEKITKKTRAIMPVHTYGHPADMDPIIETAREHDLLVIEDAAEAHGAEYKGKMTGGIGDLGCFSFYANKIITTGEGGMITTNNEELAEKARWLRSLAFGRLGKHFHHEALGFNYRISALQAALGLAQLESIEEFVSFRRNNAKLYNSILAEANDRLTLPPEASWATSVYWMYSILVEDRFRLSRDDLMRKLERNGVETRTFFYPIHVQPIYAHNYSNEEFPSADELSRKGMNLPSGNTLTQEEIQYICKCILNSSKE